MLQSSAHAASTVPWHYWMMFFLESEGITTQKVADQVPVESSVKSGNKSKGNKLVRKQDKKIVLL